MKVEREIVSNVWAFIAKASELYGRMKADHFSQQMQAHILERGLESPIEDMFYVAITAMAEAYGEATEGHPDPDREDNFGVFITPQYQVGPYRTDFVIGRLSLSYLKDIQKCEPVVHVPVIVELDGHDFHDKDKRQRSYEKARDRYLVQRGYRVLHFTGTDVCADPFKAAFEVLQLLDVFAFYPEDFAYDAANPLGID